MKITESKLKYIIQKILILERYGQENEEFTIALELLRPELDNILNQINIKIADFVGTAVSDGLTGKWQKLKKHNIKEFRNPDNLYREIYYSAMDSQINKFIDLAFQDHDQSDWELSYHKEEIREELEDYLLKSPEIESYKQQAHSYIAFGLKLLTTNPKSMHPKVLQLAQEGPKAFKYAWSMADALKII